jgi:hypothetical protein
MLHDASWHSSVDNYDTARGLRDDAAIMDGLANLVAREFPTAPPATVEQPSADLKSFMDEHFIFSTVGFKKGGSGSGRYPSGSRLATDAVIQNLGVNSHVFADRTIQDSDAHFSLAKEHLGEAKTAPTPELKQAHIRAAIAHQEAGRAHGEVERLFARGTKVDPQTGFRVWDLRNGDESAYFAHEKALSSAQEATQSATMATLEATGKPSDSDLTEALGTYGIDPKVATHDVGIQVSDSATLAYRASQMDKALEADFEGTPTPVKDLVLSLADQIDKHEDLADAHRNVGQVLLDKIGRVGLGGNIQTLNEKSMRDAVEAHINAGKAHYEAAEAIYESLPVDYYMLQDDEGEELAGISDARLTDFRLDNNEMQQLREATDAVARANEASQVALGATGRANTLS